MIYIASSQKHNGKIQEDLWIKENLTELGFSVEIIPWTKLPSILGPDDQVIFKSIWGYHQELNAFTEFISFLETKDIKTVNEIRVIKWNLEKSNYLRDIQRENIPIVDFAILKDESRYNEISDSLGTETLVLKPLIGGSGYNIFKVTNEKEFNTTVSRIKDQRKGTIAQPFLNSIDSGEISVMIIGGDIQYGMRRFPGIIAEKKSAEYISLRSLSRKIEDISSKTVSYLENRFGNTPTIIRLDYLQLDDSYKLLECEVIDPDLYFRKIPDSVRSDTIRALLKIILK